MTSAPCSASSIEACGPATPCVKSRTVMPSNAPLIMNPLLPGRAERTFSRGGSASARLQGSHASGNERQRLHPVGVRELAAEHGILDFHGETGRRADTANRRHG